MRALLLVVVVAACERADSIADGPVSFMTPSTPESIAIGVAPVQMTARETVPVDPMLLVPRVPRELANARRWFLGLSTDNQVAVRAICSYRASNPCWMMPVADPTKREMETLDDDIRDGVDSYCQHVNRHVEQCSTPLVVSLDDAAVAYTTSTFAFEPGAPVATAWPTAATPWIALDRDGDGAITSGRELFGDATGDYKNGFDALAALDANRDGIIDRADPMFARLLLWADRDGDGASSPSELRPLSDAITAIPLANHVDARCVDGSCEGERGKVLPRGAVIDVYLRRR